MQNKPYRQAVGIALYRDDKILLARKDRPAHAWQLPQGGVDAGETDQQAIIRETWEECRIQITNPVSADVVYKYNWLNPTEKNPIKSVYRGQIVTFFLQEMPADQTPTFGQHDEPCEPVEGKFMTLDEALDVVEDPRYITEVIKPLYAKIPQD